MGGIIRDTTNEVVLPVVNYRDFVKVYPAVDTTADTGNPTVAYYHGLDSSGYYQIGIYPVPSSSITLKYDYYGNPTSMSAESDVPKIPTAYHLALANFALWKYYESEENNTANYYKSLYEEDVTKAISYANEFSEGEGQFRSGTLYPLENYSDRFYNRL